jgi:hypothetical protein
MKWALIFVVAAVSMTGCGARNEAADVSQDPASSTATPAATPATPVAASSDIGIPPYPGSQEVPGSRLKMSTDAGDTVSASYRTPDPPPQVAAYYRTEGAKAGTLLEDELNIGDQLRTIGVKRNDGTRWIIKAAAQGKGGTVVTLFRTVPRAR